jgi:hypothetical protein
MSMTRAVFEELMAYRSAFGLPPIPEAGEEYGLLLSVQTKPVAIRNQLLTEAKSRRYFRAWASLTSRKSLYQIVTDRLNQLAETLERDGRGAEAAQLQARRGAGPTHPTRIPVEIALWDITTIAAFVKRSESMAWEQMPVYLTSRRRSGCRRCTRLAARHCMRHAR